MKYYQIDVCAEPKIIGVTNGVHQIEIEKRKMLQDERFRDFLVFFSYHNKDFWKTQDVIKTFTIPAINAKLLEKAKITDIMGYTENISFLNNVYSEKYIGILRAFNIGDHTTFEVLIENVFEKYYMLFVETIVSEKINFEKSLIYTGYKPRNFNIKYYKVNSHEAYIEFLKEIPIHNFEKISISKEYLGKDIIDIQVTPLPFYSEKLIDFLLDCGITGLQVDYNNSIQLEFV